MSGPMFVARPMNNVNSFTQNQEVGQVIPSHVNRQAVGSLNRLVCYSLTNQNGTMQQIQYDSNHIGM